MPGPLPNPARRRRNEPTIPTTLLPPAGRKGSVPRPPKTYPMGKAATAWWRWAWRTPQAAAWTAGDLYALARRARLEDDLEALDRLDAHHLDIALFLEVDPDERTEVVEGVISALKRLAAGELAIAKEARELDDRLGLTPKAMAQLRWSIEKPAEAAKAPVSAPATVRRLRAVDPEAATGT